MAVCTFRDRRWVACNVKGVSLGLISAWGWRRVGGAATVVTAVVMAGVGGRVGLLGISPVLSDPLLMPSLLSFSAYERGRWGLEGGAACSVVEGGAGWADRA